MCDGTLPHIFFIGHREKWDKGGIDLSARFTTSFPWIGPSGLSARACGLRYWGDYYGGAGVAFGVGAPLCVYATPSLTLGKENEVDFRQIHVGVVIHNLSDAGVGAGLPPIPIICFDYEIKF